MNFKNGSRGSHRQRRQHDHHGRDHDILADENYARSGREDKLIGRRHSSPERSRSHRGSRYHLRSRSHNRHHGNRSRHHHSKSRSASPSRKYHKRQRRDRSRRGQKREERSSSSSRHRSSRRGGRRGENHDRERRGRRGRRGSGEHHRDGEGSNSPACIVSDDSDGNNDTGLPRKRGRESSKMSENKHAGEGKWWGEVWAEGKCGDNPRYRSPSVSLPSSSVDSYNRRRSSKKHRDQRKKDSHRSPEERSGHRHGRDTPHRSHSSDDYSLSSKSRGRGRDNSDRKHKRRGKSYSPSNDRKADSRRERRRRSHRSGSRDDHSDSSRDDTKGHFKGGPGTLIGGRYRIIRDVGLGTFGRVVECSRGDTSRVAIKIVRNVRRYHDSALIEADICERVNREQKRQNKDLCAKMLDRFGLPTGHYCLVFERLGRSLYDFLKAHDYRPFPMFCVRDFSRQLLEALDFLHGFGLIHTDLKPENILLCHDDRGSNQSVPACTQVKVIDFGGATFDNEKKSSIVNTRQYRAPEVILGLGWSYPSDLWSAGCIISELYTGHLLFQTHDNTEHLALIEHAVGKFRRDILDRSKSPLARECFDSRGWHRLRGVLSSRSAAHVRKMKPIERFVSEHDRSTGFAELLRSILTIDPMKRVTARQALDSRFFA
ncbi:hypothetical protein HJC23_013793 [Cyclotella cryptica]|uniref:Protein kinase domain-containing protein n=1 Tax=Cyclotella cryptica TaxID=29204 RepID=A0ABD3PGL4_9STRA|eukprot:CCRYP_014963-RA/>CCRYP_014963-RA protein AED:0.15 eAED:0.15 QI:249/1/1/1/0.5/0.33/3/2427/656